MAKSSLIRRFFLLLRGVEAISATADLFEWPNLSGKTNIIEHFGIFVGHEQNAEGRFFIAVPSSTPPHRSSSMGIPQRAYGWVSPPEVAHVPLPLEERLRVIGSLQDSLPVKEEPSYPSNTLYYVWADQNLVAYDQPQPSTDPQCQSEWFPISVPIGLNADGPSTGWICGDFLIKSAPSQPVAPLPNDGDSLPVAPEMLSWERVSDAEYYTVELNGVEGEITFNPKFEIDQLLIPGKHTWRVYAHNYRGTTAGPLWSFFYSTGQCSVEVGNSCSHRIDLVEEAQAFPAATTSGGVVRLSVLAHDSVGHTLQHFWSSSCPALGSGGVFSSQTDQMPTWSAPINGTSMAQECTLSVSIDDGTGGISISDSLSVFVGPVEHTLRLVSPPSGLPNPLSPGGSAQLDVLASDNSADHGVTYSWSADCPGLPSDGGWTGSGTRTPQWRAPQNDTGLIQACSISVLIEDFGSGAGLSRVEDYTHFVNPGDVESLSISDGIRFLEPPPYTQGDQPTVQATLRNVSTAALVLDRVQCIVDFVDSEGFTYQRDCDAENFDPTFTLDPGGEYTYIKPLSATLGGGDVGYQGTATIHVKFQNIPGQDPVTNAEPGATAQFVFEKDHTISFVNTPFSFDNPVDSGGAATFTASGFDSMNHEELYTWSIVCPGLSSNGSLIDSGMPWMPQWMAPTNLSGIDQECTVLITVSDLFGLTTTTSFSQTVLPAVHTLTFVSGPSSSETEIVGSGSVQLSAFGVDSYEHAVTYLWSADCPALSANGLIDDSSSQSPVWESPINDTTVPATCTLSVMLGDGTGLALTEVVQVEVLPTPEPEVTTEAATNGTNTTIQLNGSAQTAGLPVDAWFEYGVGNLENMTSRFSFDGGLEGVEFNEVVPITCEIEYLFRAVVEGPGGIAEGQTLMFEQPCSLFQDGFETGGVDAWSDAVGQVVSTNAGSLFVDESLTQGLETSVPFTHFGTHSVTLEAWIKAPGSDGTFIVTINDGGTETFQIHDAGDSFYFRVHGPNPGSGSVSVPDSLVEDGEWHHLAGTYDGAMVRLYLDCQLFASTSYSQPLLESGEPLGIGLRPVDDDGAWTGFIDDVRVWDHARTAQEIFDSCMIELTGNEPGLAAYWQLDGDGADSGPNGYHLGPVNDPVFVTDAPF